VMRARAIQRWDSVLSQIEGHVVTALLLVMIGVAAGQALWFNLAERGVHWAARILEASAWVDPFLQKGTLWLAFLGASLATHEDRHFSIDLLTKIVPERMARVMLRAAALGAGLVSLALAAVFFHACLASDATVPFEYERLTVDGRQHVCDVARGAEGGVDRPELLCGLRAALALAGAPVSTVAGASQLIAPLALAIIGVRLLARAAGVLESRREPRGASEAGVGAEKTRATR
jgi:TRAP-type C4-dicarboxylate transport system permease small subunit